MDPAHVVLLLGVAITVVAIAGYLIAIATILQRVVRRLVTILGAVEAVVDTARPVGPVIDDINRDLDAGRKLVENGVERLADRRAPVEGPPPSERHAPSEPLPIEPLPAEPVSDGGGTATAAPPAPAAAPPAPAPPPPPAEDPLGRPRPGRGRGWWSRS